MGKEVREKHRTFCCAAARFCPRHGNLVAQILIPKNVHSSVQSQTKFRRTNAFCIVL